MRSISARAWLLAIVSAGLQVFMFPTGGPMPAWRSALCWIALMPLLLALSLLGRDGNSLSVRTSAILGYLCGFLWYFGNCFWIYQTMYLYGGLPKPVAFGIVVLFSLYLGLYHALFGALFAAVCRLKTGMRGALWLSPFLWVAVELARARITGFPWDLLGYAQVDNWLVTRIAPVAGVMGVSFLVMVVNATFSAAFRQARQRQWVVGLVGLAAAVGLQFCARNPPSHMYQALPHQEAVLLQENLSVGAMGREVQPESLEAEMASFSAFSLSPEVLPSHTQPARPDLIVWPEAPSRLRSDDPFVRQKLGELAWQQSVPIIAGSLGIDSNAASSRGYSLYDSASLFAADGSYHGRYDKIHLVPWGEYVPYKQLFSFAEKLTEGVGNMDPGHERSVFRTGGHSYGVFICYESIFGDEVRQFAANGAQVLVNISDDGWYGETGAPWQHLNMARMRAIENNRWVLRSTNTGVTTSIDSDGRVWAQAPRHVRAAFLLPFSFVEATTFYTRHGDWFAYLCAITAVLCAAAGMVRRPLLK